MRIIDSSTDPVIANLTCNKDKEDLSGIFDEVLSPVSENTFNTIEILDLPLNWKGILPTDLLKEWLNSNCEGSKAIFSQPNNCPSDCFKSILKISTSKETQIFEMNEYCKTKIQAMNYVATNALYVLCNDSLKTRLPPVYREAWNKWANEKKVLEMEKCDKHMLTIFKTIKNEAFINVPTDQYLNHNTKSLISKPSYTKSNITSHISTDWKQRLCTETYGKFLVYIH
jgi:hypothetical protein